MVFVKGDLQAKLYRKKCSMPAFLQNLCHRAGWKTDKTLANVLIVLGSCPRRRWPIPNLQHLWLWAPGSLCKTENQKERADIQTYLWCTIHRGEGFRSWSNLGRKVQHKKVKRLDMAWQCLAQLTWAGKKKRINLFALHLKPLFPCWPLLVRNTSPNHKFIISIYFNYSLSPSSSALEVLELLSLLLLCSGAGALPPCNDLMCLLASVELVCSLR